MLHRMHLYSVHIKPGELGSIQKPVFVKEGFSLWAFVLTLPWLLYQKLWGKALMVLAFNILMAVLVNHQILTSMGGMIIQTGFGVFVAYQANDWVRGRLSRRGYIFADVSAADSLLRAEQRYFERQLAAA